MTRWPTWLALLSLSACEASSAPSLAFRLRFANPETAARASTVEVSILKGSCSSNTTVYTSWVTRESEGSLPPRLDPGSYALLGRAANAECGLIAYGCVQTALPTSDGAIVEIVLDDVPEQPICTGACADACGSSEDGGTNPQIDAGPDETDGSLATDAGVQSDASSSGQDAGVEAGVDAGPPCDAEIGPDNHCYRFDSTKLNFNAAEARCVAWGGHLVSFNDADEELWVTDKAASLRTFDEAPIRFWIGFSDAAKETVWRWLDNSGTTSQITFDLGNPDKSTRFKTTSLTPYTHWGPNIGTAGNSEPNNGNGDNPASDPGEDCAESRSDRISAPGGVITPRPEWDDSSCSALKRSVCERL